jgi:meso-butanediol dehydrogenase / (S,S)-butanediol dehydrogenase / diacetyl reductase
MTTHQRLRGKVALVTGAGDARSIGWGIAAALAAEGADVAVNDINPAELPAREADLVAWGVRGLGLPGNVADSAAVDAMFAHTVATLGRLDIVVSNAGIIRWEHFKDITPATVRLLTDVNLKGNVYVCRAAARQMIAQGSGGRLIITSSVQASMHFPITPVYGATKHAMFPFVGSLALELAPYGITVNHIGPGWVRSALNDRAPDQQDATGIENNRQAVPLKRAGLPAEMGRAVVYYAGPDGDYVTGTYLRVDGGLGISKYSP